MVNRDRVSVEEIVRKAKLLAAELGPLSCDPTEAAALPLRLAQAHVLGLLDQLSEIVAAGRPTTEISIPMGAFESPRIEDEVLQPC